MHESKSAWSPEFWFASSSRIFFTVFLVVRSLFLLILSSVRAPSTNFRLLLAALVINEGISLLNSHERSQYTRFYKKLGSPPSRGGHSLKRDCRTGRGTHKIYDHALNPRGCQTLMRFWGPSPSLLNAQYFGNVPLVFLLCSKFARSLCYCTPISDSYQMRLTI